jgi:hypothetical protein
MHTGREVSRYIVAVAMTMKVSLDTFFSLVHGADVKEPIHLCANGVYIRSKNLFFVVVVKRFYAIV